MFDWRRWSTYQLSDGATIMGKYLLGWLLGVPVFVLVLVYLFFH